MININNPLERILQNFRFSKVKNHLIGDVLDFGGNDGELGRFVSGKYTIINYDHTELEKNSYDTIVSLAVIEHIDKDEVFKIFKIFKKVLKTNGLIYLTTPTPSSKIILETLANIGLLERQNILEHKYYWNEKDISDLAKETGFAVKEYQKFQFGFNQFAIFVHKQ